MHSNTEDAARNSSYCQLINEVAREPAAGSEKKCLKSWQPRARARAKARARARARAMAMAMARASARGRARLL